MKNPGVFKIKNFGMRHKGYTSIVKNANKSRVIDKLNRKEKRKIKEETIKITKKEENYDKKEISKILILFEAMN